MNKVRENKGIELLRIICMLMVVILHFTGLNVPTRLLSNLNIYSVNGFFGYFLTALCVVSVNCFVLITGYFNINKSFKTKKAISYLTQGLFFSVVIYLFAILIWKRPITISEIGNSLLILSTNKWWFLNAFFFLYLCTPILNSFLVKINIQMLKKMLLWSLILMIIWPTILFFIPGSSTSGDLIGFNSGFSVIWFIFLYILGAYLKLSNFKNKFKANIWFKGYFLCSSFIVLSLYVISAITNNPLKITYFFTYTSFLTILGSVCLFCGFLNMNVKNKLLFQISTISRYTFGVYLFHEHPLIRNYLEITIYNSKAIEYKGSYQLWLLLILVVIILYFFGIITEYIRVVIFEKIHLDSKLNLLVDKINYKIDGGN